MTYKYLSAILLFSALLFTLPEISTAQQAGETHTVQAGETLSSIARDFDVSTGDIRRWNNLQNDNLSPGQEIKVGPPAEEEDATIHEVESGQTLFAISRMYNVTIAELQAWNNLEDTSISVGQRLVIYDDEDAQEPDEMPDAAALEEASEELEPVDRESIVRMREARGGTSYYTVRSGDTLTRIATEHDMTVQELRDLNNLDGDVISVGQRLAVREDIQSAPSIAEEAEESTPQGKFANYRLESNESVQDLLDRFNMNRRELQRLNPDIDLEEASGGQRLTVLLPPTRESDNPYLKRASLENLGEVGISLYSERDIAKPTTSGELYNPDQLTAAHSNISLGNVVYVENPENGVGVYVKVNDRYSGSGLKLSQKAFDMLQFSSEDDARVAIFVD